MEADFSGWATKAGLQCSDGRTIMPDAFKHQDTAQVPLVWQHGHNDPENVLGHVLLTNKTEGVWCEAFFNKSKKAAHALEAVQHKDINALSIWANGLVEKSKKVLHGAIREVSLVLAGANPGALIENVTIRHAADGSDDEVLEDEAIIYTGVIVHADGGGDIGGDGGGDDGETIQDVYDSMSEKQKQVVHFMVGEALASSGGDAAHSDLELDENASNQEIYDTMTDQQKEVLHFMVGEALGEKKNDDGNDGGNNNDDTKGTEMKHNVFEKGNDKGEETHVLSHSDMETLMAAATKGGSLKEAVEEYALAHGIQDIDTLFPEAKAISTTPELFGRRVEWVNVLMNGVRKSPFSRIKTLSADITVAEARAKGYIKGNLKKEEFFRVSKRITVPQTVYKKQKLDRDDMIDITDFDVVVWLKGEMRLMLDEEIARAILVGDGRAVDDEDKINEDNIRSVANDHELYTTTINVNIDDAGSSMSEVVDTISRSRSSLRGSGQPTMFTTEGYIGRFLTQRDNVGRRIYRSLDDVATELRVSTVVPVEILEEYTDIVAIIFNPTDYVVGADKGGAVAMFDDFDIDYNQYKYLIETRCSGALVKLKSALVVRKVPAASQLVAPAAPAFDGDGVTITNQTGVVYRNAATDAVMDAAGSPYPVADGETITVEATPAAGYYFADSDNDSWPFTGTV